MSETIETILPPGFEALEPFAAVWVVNGGNERAQLRVMRSEAERRAFYEAAKDLLAPALARLDAKPLARFDAAERRLMKLMLVFAHVATAVEIQGDHEPRHAQASRHMRITRTPADLHA